MISLVSEYFLAIALFFSFITLIFYGFPVAWTMGGLGVLFIFISMLSDNLFDTFYGVDFGFASMVVYRLYGGHGKLGFSCTTYVYFYGNHDG